MAAPRQRRGERWEGISAVIRSDPPAQASGTAGQPASSGDRLILILNFPGPETS